MGLIALMGLGAYIAVGLAVIAGVRSSIRHYSNPFYGVFVIFSVVLLPWLFFPEAPDERGGDYGNVMYFLAGAFSFPSILCVTGGVACCFLASDEAGPLAQAASGAAWGFLVLYVIRIITLL